MRYTIKHNGKNDYEKESPIQITTIEAVYTELEDKDLYFLGENGLFIACVRVHLLVDEVRDEVGRVIYPEPIYL